MTAACQRLICDLRDRIASMEGVSAKQAGTLSFGVSEIDAVLPGGGLAYGALHEFAGGGSGTVDGAAAALCVAGIAARTKGPVIWCLPRIRGGLYKV
jgi:protein ImuA